MPKASQPLEVDIQNLIALANWDPPEGIRHAITWDPRIARMICALQYDGEETFIIVRQRALTPTAFGILRDGALALKASVDAFREKYPDAIDVDPDLIEAALHHATGAPITTGPAHILPTSTMGHE